MFKCLYCFLVLFFVACASDSQSDLTDSMAINRVTYANNVKGIIDNNCTICHNSGQNPIAPFPLETYLEVRDKTKFGSLLNRIQLPDGDPAIMPKTGKMPQKLIDVVVVWAAKGYIKN
ncbi:MAG: cytochrome c [Flavobacteriaceae bacterium]|nr:cytochrome c [Flavobacteriaceae bacterium]